MNDIICYLSGYIYSSPIRVTFFIYLKAFNSFLYIKYTLTFSLFYFMHHIIIIYFFSIIIHVFCYKTTQLY